jgi:hypothetical protein
MTKNVRDMRDMRGKPSGRRNLLFFDAAEASPRAGVLGKCAWQTQFGLGSGRGWAPAVA